MGAARTEPIAKLQCSSLAYRVLEKREPSWFSIVLYGEEGSIARKRVGGVEVEIIAV
jgi:hypothetical protein